MRLSSIKAGDIVLVDKRGRVFYARVVDRADGQLVIEPMAPAISYRHAKAREVVGHWRQMGGR